MTAYIDSDQRRARLAVRHRLAQPAADVVEAASALVGLHSSDPATVYLSARARVPGMGRQHLDTALYEDKTLVRILGMRRTMFVVPTGIATAVHNASAFPLAAAERRRAARMVEDFGISDDGAAWVDAVAGEALAALRVRGEAVAAELVRDVPGLAEKVTVYKADGSVLSRFGMSTRILFLLATEGKVIRARPRGTWVSSQYRWAAMEDWLGGPLGDVDKASAQQQVLARYLSSFGPATETDIRWWTGWPVTEVRKALARLEAVEVDLESGRGLVLPGDVDSMPEPGHWAALLPSLDPTVMGWKERSWYLGEHERRLFDRTGNAGPTVWVDGRVVGGWTQRPNGEVVWSLLEPVGREIEDEIAALAGELETWTGPVSVTARFRSLLDLELSSRSAPEADG